MAEEKVQVSVAETDEASVTCAAKGAVADTSGLQLLADCAVKMIMEETSKKPALRSSFIADTSGLQLLADCAVKMMMEETAKKPALRPSFIAYTSGLQLLADCAVKMMEEISNKPALRPSFDLNRPPMDTEL